MLVAALMIAFTGLVLAEPEATLLAQFNKVRSDEAAAMAFIQSLSKPQILALCNQYGESVDRGDEGDEGMLIEIALSEIKASDPLTSSDLLRCVEDETASLHWKRLALRYASGASRLIDNSKIDQEAVFRLSTNIMHSADFAPVLRAEACQSAARSIIHGYYRAVSVSGEKGKSLRAKLRSAETSECTDSDEKAARFIGMALTLADDAATPEELKDKSIPKALRLIVRERGAKTPRLEQVRAFTEQHAKDTAMQRKSSYAKLLREVKATSAKPRSTP